MIFEFIFYSIIFWIVIKVLNAISRWWKRPVQKDEKVHMNNSANYKSKYQNVEEAEFTEIKSEKEKEKAQD